MKNTGNLEVQIPLRNYSVLVRSIRKSHTGSEESKPRDRTDRPLCRGTQILLHLPPSDGAEPTCFSQSSPKVMLASNIIALSVALPPSTLRMLRMLCILTNDTGALVDKLGAPISVISTAEKSRVIDI